MNITIVNPRGAIHGKRELHMSILYLSTALHRQGYNVNIVDSQIENVEKKLKTSILKSDVIGFTVMTDHVRDALKLSDLVKETDSDIPIVWGGIHPTLYPTQTIQDESIDYVVVGEGELTLLELMSHFEGKINLNNIKGLAYQENDNVKINPKRDFIDLNTLSPPEWKLLKLEEYVQDFKIGGRSLGKTLPIHSGRGCSYRCRFCLNLLDNRWRPLSAENILNEVKILTEKYKLEYINFTDDNFFSNRKRVEDFSKALISEKIDIKWQGCCRANYFNANHVNDYLMQLVKKSGCTTMAVGVESGSQRIIDMLNKEITLEQVLKAVKMCKKYDMYIFCSFMIGLPNEEKEDMLETLKLIKKIITINPKAYIIGPQVYRPYPGCSLYNEVAGMFKAPSTLREWAETKIFEGYTSTDTLPWIQEPNIVENASFYVMRSLSNPSSYTKSLIEFPFKKLAQFRLDHNIFDFNVDRKIFEFGKKTFINR